MLISGFFILFVSCIVYMHVDLSISKSSASYLAKLQWDEVRRMSYHVPFSVPSDIIVYHRKN
jgi:oligosaccharyltransferase complex subunit alpha (ribophorin I)